MLLRATTASALLCTVLCAQASYNYIDQNAPYANPNWNGTPLLEALNLPKLGGALRLKVQATVDYSNGLYIDQGFIFFGMRNPDTLLYLPHGVQAWMYTSAEFVIPTTRIYHAFGGLVEMTFPIPNVAALAGTKIYHQVFVVKFNALVPYAPYNTVVLSRGGVATLGR